MGFVRGLFYWVRTRSSGDKNASCEAWVIRSDVIVMVNIRKMFVDDTISERSSICGQLQNKDIGDHRNIYLYSIQASLEVKSCRTIIWQNPSFVRSEELYKDKALAK